VTRRAVSIALKIPDNTAYTALVALRRLGVGVDRIERSDVRFFDDDGDLGELVARIESDETIFNPNKHRLSVLEAPAPRAGEVWIESRGAEATGAVAWRLFDAQGEPVGRAVLDAAIERLLCNAAIDRAVTQNGPCDRDNPKSGE
jgi:hypothetical protein